MTTQTLGAYTPDRASIEALSDGLYPKWVTDARLAAFEKYLASPMPGDRSEGWRRTNFAGVDLSPVAPERAECAFTVATADSGRGLIVDTFEDAVKRGLPGVANTDTGLSILRTRKRINKK